MGGLLGFLGSGAIINGTFGRIDGLSVLVLAAVFLVAELVVLSVYVLVRRVESAAPTSPTKP